VENYGFKWNPHGRTHVIYLVVETFCFLPLEADRVHSMRGAQWGCWLNSVLVLSGRYADLLLVNRRTPVAVFRFFRGTGERFLAIMKDGDFHKSPNRIRARSVLQPR